MQRIPIRHHTHRIHEVDEGIGAVERQIAIGLTLDNHSSSGRGVEYLPREFAVLAEVEAMFGLAHVREPDSMCGGVKKRSRDARRFGWNYVGSCAFWSACGTTGMRAEHL